MNLHRLTSGEDHDRHIHRRELLRSDLDPETELVDLALSKSRSSTRDRLLAAAASESSPASSADPRDGVSRGPQEGTVKREPVRQQAEAEARGTPRQAVVSGTGAGPVKSPENFGQATPRPAGPINPDEARDLTDLLNKIA